MTDWSLVVFHVERSAADVAAEAVLEAVPEAAMGDEFGDVATPREGTTETPSPAERSVILASADSVVGVPALAEDELDPFGAVEAPEPGDAIFGSAVTACGACTPSPMGSRYTDALGASDVDVVDCALVAACGGDDASPPTGALAGLFDGLGGGVTGEDLGAAAGISAPSPRPSLDIGADFFAAFLGVAPAPSEPSGLRVR